MGFFRSDVSITKFGPERHVINVYANGRMFRLEGQYPTVKSLQEEYTDTGSTVARIELTRKNSAGHIRWEGTHA